MTYAMPATLPNPDYDPSFYDGVPAKRVFAWLIDIVLISIVTLVPVLLTFGVLGFFWPILYLVLSFLYRSITISMGSATLGMRLMNIELRNAHGQRLSPTEAAFHTGLYLISWSFVLLQLISIFLMATGSRHQGLHDHILGTAAINRPR